MLPQFRIKQPPLVDRLRPYKPGTATIIAAFFMGGVFGFCVSGGLAVMRDLLR